MNAMIFALNVLSKNKKKLAKLKVNKKDDRTLLCDALRNLGPFVQFKKREKHLWKSVASSKVADLVSNFT